MSCAQTVERYLDSHNVSYEMVSHPRCYTSLGAVHLTNIDPERMAKAVLLEDDRGYMVAVVPASCQVKLRKLRREVGRPLWMASEAEMIRLFPDCDRGAIPAIASAYGLETVVDESLMAQPDVYFEAGDHEHLIHMRTEDFAGMMQSARRAQFSAHM
jgi:Ala-tRNA(Pro) deacylase